MTVRERMALTLAATPYRYPAMRERRALEDLGMSPTRFAQVVGALLDRADAEAEMPREVRRLRRLREARARARGARRAAA